jgi:hypothetical protein
MWRVCPAAAHKREGLLEEISVSRLASTKVQILTQLLVQKHKY